MRKFLFNVSLMAALVCVFLECFIRYRHLTIEVPKRTITTSHIQKYLPNQSGYWKGGTHKWQVNKLGWVGPLPEAWTNLITIVGDSHIENLMNADECRQSAFLKSQLPNFNFLEAARAGVSFIEAIEICNSLDSLRPLVHLIYVKNSDFTESIANLRRREDITQIDVDSGLILYGRLRSARMKEVLYASKLVYFLYGKAQRSLSTTKPRSDNAENVESTDELIGNSMDQIERLFAIVRSTYDVSDKVLIFHPGSDARLLRLSELSGFNVLQLHPEIYPNWSWSRTDNSHWHCDGHKEGASQVASHLRNSLKSNVNLPLGLK